MTLICPECTHDLDFDFDCFECGSGKYARDCKCIRNDWLCPDHRRDEPCSGGREFGS